jgi:hypothetical protein
VTFFQTKETVYVYFQLSPRNQTAVSFQRSFSLLFTRETQQLEVQFNLITNTEPSHLINITGKVVSVLNKVLCHKEVRVSGDIDARILNLDTRRRFVLSFRPRTLYPRAPGR